MAGYESGGGVQLSRTVFILGAGASAGAGVPLLKDFLRTADKVRTEQNKDLEDREFFDLVFRARQELTAIHSKAQLDLDNFEEIYSAFEMASLIGRLGQLDEQNVRQLPLAMRRVISLTIERSMRLPVTARDNGGRVLPPKAYDAFVKAIAPLIQQKDVALLTFNYDLALDYALYFYRVEFNYGFSNDNGLQLLKLHGSLNWGRCSSSSCKKISVWTLQEYFDQYRWPLLFDVDSVPLDMASKLASRTHCGTTRLEKDPVLIPPTWNKGGFHRELDVVWTKAASHLADAENIYVIGYSFPTSDQFFKYFFAVGSVGSGWIDKVRLIDPDPTGEVEERFKSLLGPRGLARFSPIKSTFEKVAGQITG